jgi:hypothetical protein
MRKLLLIYVLFLMTPAVAAAQFGVENDFNQVRIAFDDPARVGLVQVRIIQGQITVKAYDGKDVVIEASGANPRELVGPREAEGLRRLSTRGGLAAIEENNVITIRSERMNNMNLTIQVPTRTNLKLDAEVGGNIVVEGVEGDIEVNDTLGNVTLTGIGGSVVAHSTNGRIQVAMKSVSPDKPMAFTTVNGSVDVTLPVATKANLKLRTTNGDVYTDFDVRTIPIAPLQTRLNGRTRVELENSIVGTINGGGPDFELRTVNGNVYIRKAK